MCFRFFLKLQLHCSASIKIKITYDFPTQVLRKIGTCKNCSIENEMQVNDDDEDIFNSFEENN